MIIGEPTHEDYIFNWYLYNKPFGLVESHSESRLASYGRQQLQQQHDTVVVTVRMDGEKTYKNYSSSDIDKLSWIKVRRPHRDSTALEH